MPISYAFLSSLTRHHIPHDCLFLSQFNSAVYLTYFFGSILWPLVSLVSWCRPALWESGRRQAPAHSHVNRFHTSLFGGPGSVGCTSLRGSSGSIRKKKNTAIFFFFLFLFLFLLLRFLHTLFIVITEEESSLFSKILPESICLYSSDPS
jgi:hypothetical protein